MTVSIVPQGIAAARFAKCLAVWVGRTDKTFKWMFGPLPLPKPCGYWLPI